MTYETLGGYPASPDEPVPGIPKCPLLMIADILAVSARWHNTEEVEILDTNHCLGGDCGFWSDRHEMCSIAALVDTLNR